MKANGKTSWLRWTALLFCLGLVGTSTGCQVHVGGMTLPSPWYQYDDVQYFAPGPEFKLSREAAAQKEYKAEAALRNQQQQP